MDYYKLFVRHQQHLELCEDYSAQDKIKLWELFYQNVGISHPPQEKHSSKRNVYTEPDPVTVEEPPPEVIADLEVVENPHDCTEDTAEYTQDVDIVHFEEKPQYAVDLSNIQDFDKAVTAINIKRRKAKMIPLDQERKLYQNDQAINTRLALGNHKQLNKSDMGKIAVHKVKDFVSVSKSNFPSFLDMNWSRLYFHLESIPEYKMAIGDETTPNFYKALKNLEEVGKEFPDTSISPERKKLQRYFQVIDQDFGTLLQYVVLEERIRTFGEVDLYNYSGASQELAKLRLKMASGGLVEAGLWHYYVEALKMFWQEVHGDIEYFPLDFSSLEDLYEMSKRQESERVDVVREVILDLIKEILPNWYGHSPEDVESYVTWICNSYLNPRGVKPMKNFVRKGCDESLRRTYQTPSHLFSEILFEVLNPSGFHRLQKTTFKVPDWSMDLFPDQPHDLNMSWTDKHHYIDLDVYLKLRAYLTQKLPIEKLSEFITQCFEDHTQPNHETLASNKNYDHTKDVHAWFKGCLSFNFLEDHIKDNYLPQNYDHFGLNEEREEIKLQDYRILGNFLLVPQYNSVYSDHWWSYFEQDEISEIHKMYKDIKDPSLRYFKRGLEAIQRRERISPAKSDLLLESSQK